MVLVHLLPLKRHMMIKERNTGHSFYGQDSSKFFLFFGSRLFISKGVFLFVQGHVKGRSQGMKYLIMSLSLGDVLEEGIQGIILTRGGRGQMGSGGDSPGMVLQMSGTPHLFSFPTLSAVPLSMGHDNQWWRDLLGDLGPICRWRCSEHHLLRAESTASLFFHFLFISDLFISLSAWLCLVPLSCHHAYALASAWLTHPPLLVIMLTLICHFCLLLQTLPPWLHSLYAQPYSSYPHYFLLYSYQF